MCNNNQQNQRSHKWIGYHLREFFLNGLPIFGWILCTLWMSSVLLVYACRTSSGESLPAKPLLYFLTTHRGRSQSLHPGASSNEADRLLVERPPTVSFSQGGSKLEPQSIPLMQRSEDSRSGKPWCFVIIIPLNIVIVFNWFWFIYRAS